jgi:amylosucrase
VFPGSFATGALFQENPETGDRRNSGTTASLAGLERALKAGDKGLEDAAIDRILMGHALIASFGGIPLLYMGDEIALLNDWSYTSVPGHAHDSRWLHRPAMDWGRGAQAEAGAEPGARVLAGLRHILARRAATPELHAAYPTLILDTGQVGLFAFARAAPTGSLVCVFNFTEFWTTLRHEWALSHGARALHDALSDAPVTLDAGRILLPPFARVWLR